MFGDVKLDLSALILGLAGLFFQARKNAKENKEISKDIKEIVIENRDGVKHIHRYQLHTDMRNAIARGWTTQHDLEEVAKLHESYTALGGNGAITVLYQKFIRLPLKSEGGEEYAKMDEISRN